MAAGTLVSSGSSGSMPTGSGSERLCRATIHGNDAFTQEILSGTAGHIYTILSIIFQDQQGAAGTCSIRVNTGSDDIKILESFAFGTTNRTFVWNDKFVMEGDDDLDVYNSTNDGDWYVSYIDQDWT